MVREVLAELLSRGVLGVTSGVTITRVCMVYVASLEPVPIILLAQRDINIESMQCDFKMQTKFYAQRTVQNARRKSIETQELHDIGVNPQILRRGGQTIGS